MPQQKISGSRNVSHQQQSLWRLLSHRPSHQPNNWYYLVQPFNNKNISYLKRWKTCFHILTFVLLTILIFDLLVNNNTYSAAHLESHTVYCTYQIYCKYWLHHHIIIQSPTILHGLLHKCVPWIQVSNPTVIIKWSPLSPLMFCHGWSKSP